MKITFEIQGGRYAADMAQPIDISIPVSGEGKRLVVYGVPPARMEPLRVSGFTGSVEKGGSANCEVNNFIAHCHGTHTECVGHLSKERINITEILHGGLMPATLVTVTPENARSCGETCHPAPQIGDSVITRKTLETIIGLRDDAFMTALVIRTTPNDEEKKTRNYDTQMPSYFTLDAMNYIAERDITHLIVDVPSVDRLADEGKLANHRIFWGVPGGSSSVLIPSPRTITELAYIPDYVTDGPYLLNLQVAAFAADAAPSHPLLYRIKKET